MTPDEHHERMEQHLRVDPSTDGHHHEAGHHIEHVHDHGQGHGNVGSSVGEITVSTVARVSGGLCGPGTEFDFDFEDDVPLSMNERRSRMLEGKEGQ